MVYVLEVQKAIEVSNISSKIFEHVGYMKALFKTKQSACNYYDTYNKHMRSLNAHDTWCSDWDPVTKLRYVVRKHNNECKTIDPFNPNDMPIITVKDGSVQTTYPTYHFPNYELKLKIIK